MKYPLKYEIMRKSKAKKNISINYVDPKFIHQLLTVRITSRAGARVDRLVI